MAICNQDREMNIVIVGHVDHGKSTVIGRLLADTGSLPEGKLEQIKELCRRTSKPFEYAFLLDALKDERSQGITIDTARCFFKTKKRKYIIIDAPGHIEFLKNMITGASRADAALLVIDAHEGICENSRRHAYMLSMLGIGQIAVLVNKLDLIAEGERESVYNSIVRDYTEFLKKIDLHPTHYIPVSAAAGYNITRNAPELPWYSGITVLDALDAFTETLPPDNLPFRMWVQDVYKFTGSGDERRIIAGTVSSGKLRTGDEIMLMPSGKKTTVKTIEAFNEPAKSSVGAGSATGFCMAEQIYAKRGELICVIGQNPPKIAGRILASVFWLGHEPLTGEKSYKLKIGSAQVGCRLESVSGVLNAATLDSCKKNIVERHEVASCILRLDRPIAFDISGSSSDTSRFVLVDNYEISGGGIITDIPSESDMSEKLTRRNIKWIKSSITANRRAEYYGQQAHMVVITGKTDTDKKSIARDLEKRLLDSGRIAYYLGLGNLLYGVNSDIKSDNSMYAADERAEHIRRLGELANIMLDAGNILIVTANELDFDELDTLYQTVSLDAVTSVWVGEQIHSPRDFDLCFDKTDDVAGRLAEILLQTPST